MKPITAPAHNTAVRCKGGSGGVTFLRTVVYTSVDLILDDIDAALDAIAEHLIRGDLNDGLVFDAVRFRLIEIGEAVEAIGPELLETEGNIPWADVAGMRDHLAHHYFDTPHAIVQATIDHDLPALRDAVGRLRTKLVG